MSEKIPKGWKWVKLGEVVTLQRGYDLPKSKMKKGNIPVVGSNGIIGYHNKATTKAPGITIGRSGNIGNAYLHKSDFWAHNTTLYVKDFKGNDVIFLFYLFKNIDFNQLNAGSAVPTLNRNHIYPIEVKIPIRIEDQKAIAEVLSSIDDKIDLLHRQNKTLEEIAMTLFRQWFMGDNISNDIIELGSLVDIISGISYKSTDLNPSTTAMVSLKCFDRNGEFRIDGFKEFTGNYKEQHIVKEGDLIVAHTDITQDAEVIGNPAIVISNPKYTKMVISMDIVKVIPKVNWISIEFLYFLMRTREFKGHCEGSANGSTVLHLSKQAIPTFEFKTPKREMVIEFTKQAKELLNKTFLNQRQILTLIHLRDTLLPKLMSGEVRVKF